MDQMQSESVGQADRGLCDQGHCHRHRTELAEGIPAAVRPGRKACGSAEQQHDMGHVSAGAGSKAVFTARELPGLHHGAGVL